MAAKLQIARQDLLADYLQYVSSSSTPSEFFVAPNSYFLMRYGTVY